MEKGIIKNVSIEDFKTNENFVNYVDDDFMVINSLENVPYSNGTVRLNCFLLISCLEGSIQLDMNDKTYQLQKDDLIFGLPVRHHQPYHAESSTQNKHHRFLHSISATRLQDGEK